MTWKGEVITNFFMVTGYRVWYVSIKYENDPDVQEVNFALSAGTLSQTRHLGYAI